MMLKRTIAATIATGALLFSALATPAFADTTLTISGNGTSSVNTTDVSNSNTTTVVQSNDAQVDNNISTTTETGNNTASANTGGSTMISTGTATNTTDVSTSANLNQANVSGCNTCGGSETVKISGNGANSINSADLTSDKTTAVFQDNQARINNNIESHASTGNNDASLNTGGTTLIGTGNAASNVIVKNRANANIATTSGGGGGGGSLGILIDGNGASSVNTVDITKDMSNIVEQTNAAWINNNIHANAETGRNDADANTGGDVMIRTGSAQTNIDVSNNANFNAADVNCGCLTNVTAKISGNGANSISAIIADLSSANSIFQGGDKLDGESIWEVGAGNLARLNNSIGGHVETGENNTSLNTGVPADPVIVLTGNTSSTTTVSNNSNVNIAGPFTGLTLPTGNFSFDFNLDLGALMGFLHLGLS